MRNLALLPVLLLGIGAASPARAQFSLFGSQEASAADVADMIAAHGFRLVGPLYRNGRVYLADVVDRRQRRERLVVAAETGQIVQRFFVDLGPERRAAVASRAPQDDSFFSHLTRGWDDEPPPRPPLGLATPDGFPPNAAPPQSRPRATPKVVTRTDPGVAPITASPLPPPQAVSAPAAPREAAPAKPEVVAVPTTPAAPPTATSAPSSVRATSVSRDPLRIPGARKPDDTKPAAVATKAPDPAPIAKPKAPATSDVPIAPLD